jgi:hypothetical protein
MNEKAILLKKEITRIVKRRDKLSDDLVLKMSELEKCCLHNDSRYEDDYESGSYYDKSKFIKKEICNVCGKELNKTVTTGNYE